jgi:uncharacterized secreted protein with C-terminal beta-propeller domain
MSEFDGHLRVATTVGGLGVSSVRILRVADGKLTQVGEVGGLGKGEQIYSVRFIGPRAYVVTFRQTDPLYSLDLSEPAKPKVTGELKITGYSAHLQPVGENRLVGIGQEADAQGVPTGLQVSLFDVTDPATPKRLDQHRVAGGQSEAESDAKADGGLALHVSGDRLSAATRLAPPAANAGPMRRALVVGDVLWAVTEGGLLASNASTLDRVAWVALT